jgi:hypothetical protein
LRRATRSSRRTCASRAGCSDRSFWTWSGRIYGYLLSHYAISALICKAVTAAGISGFPPEQAERTLARVMADITSETNQCLEGAPNGGYLESVSKKYR